MKKRFSFYSEISEVWRQKIPIGRAVEKAKKLSQESYNAAQEDRKRSNKLQSTWEKENKSCLDTENYRVDYR